MTGLPGDPADLVAAVDSLAGAGFAPGVVEAHLEGPAVVAPGWIGRDAAAAARPGGDDPAEWPALLGRRWTDGGRQLAELVALAGRDPAGAVVVTAALSAVGEHLVPGGDHVLPVDRATWATVAPALTVVAVAHVAVLPGPLGAPDTDGSAVVLAGVTCCPPTRCAVTSWPPGCSGPWGPTRGPRRRGRRR